MYHAMQTMAKRPEKSEVEELDEQERLLAQDDPASLIKEHRGYYLLVNAISKRVRELQLGERALALPADGSHDPVKIATQEILEGKVDIVPKARMTQEMNVLEESEAE